MKTNTNITYKEFKETDIFKSAVIIEFVNSQGTTLKDIYDKDLDNMIVVDYNYDSGWMEIILREEETDHADHRQNFPRFRGIEGHHPAHPSG